MRRNAVGTVMSLLLLGATQSPLWAQEPSAQQTDDEDAQISIWKEAGYVLAMETFFVGMSFVGSRKDPWGPTVTGGFDVFMAVAGLENASLKESGVQKTGHYLISAGFAAKSFYNLYLGRDHRDATQFWTNFIGYNVLVFVGYFLDTL